MRYRCKLCCDGGKIRGVAGTQDSFCGCVSGIRAARFSDLAKKEGCVRGESLKVERTPEKRDKPKPNKKNLRKKPTSFLAYTHKRYVAKKKLLQVR